MSDKLLTKHCLRAKICEKSGLSKLVLCTSGCTKYAECEDFLEKNDKIKDKILRVNAGCTKVKCNRDGRERCKDDCVDCQGFKLDEQNRKRALELHARCINEYCYNGKKEIELKCLDCIECRLFSIDKQAWTSFRGGKDIKGRNL